MQEIKGKVFNIQHYSIHDGPGIRTTFFFKGCPLSCKWCQNPESQSFLEELLVIRDRCVGCGACVEACPQKAIKLSHGKAVTDRSQCNACGNCIQACTAGIREICGKEYTIEELVQQAMEDQLFYKGSGGGVTVSGGEPLSQAEFVGEFLKQLKELGVHTTVDTTGFASWERAWSVLQHADLVLYDVKHMDSGKHRELTGVPNEVILDNLIRLSHEKVNVYIRIPVIPGMNDSDENIRNIAKFVKRELGGHYKTYLLPYHRMGESKLVSLEKTKGYLSLEVPSQKHMQHLKEFFDSMGLESQIGG